MRTSCGAPPPDDGPPDEPPPNASCTTAIDVTPNGPGQTREVTGTTWGAADVASLSCNPRAAPEVYYVWTSWNDDYGVTWTVSQGFAVGLAQAEESCGPGPFFCESSDEWFDAHTHTLVVERTDADCGPFTLRVTRNY